MYIMTSSTDKKYTFGVPFNLQVGLYTVIVNTYHILLGRLHISPGSPKGAAGEQGSVQPGAADPAVPGQHLW